MKHTVKSIRDTSSGEHLLICSCGASRKVFRDEDLFEVVKDFIRSHKEPVAVEPPLKISGFVSGLPDKRR